MISVREPAVAGLFYPGLQGTLSQQVDELLLRAKTVPVRGVLKALIAPHAGYQYSGYTAAIAYKSLKNLAFDSVVVVGPSHREYFDGISVFSGDAFKTPLGEIPVDNDLRNIIVEQNNGIMLAEAGHREEHSVEVQLPFLQRVLGRFSFVPIVMGDQRREYCDVLATALARSTEGRNVLLVASSDLSHYHTYRDAVRLDKNVIELVEQYDPDTLLERLDQEEVEACGGGPIAAVMKAAKILGATAAKSLFYCNSGDVTGEKETVVGYLSAALSQES